MSKILWGLGVSVVFMIQTINTTKGAKSTKGKPRGQPCESNGVLRVLRDLRGSNVKPKERWAQPTLPLPPDHEVPILPRLSVSSGLSAASPSSFVSLLCVPASLRET